ncbi:MAG: hypothetical protein A2826_02725 [Candidatus Doudnabacteria bacterium RIFCSPHIGHO2_01_FULL_43_23]|uniref:Transposase IS200-like domain-containing protein n=1 Tax=Candidatus Doudnabacteria bacterium RIFCSPHIGHO2_01_FULL_43_23 TaxID=1817822 RepID=A0A1F5NRP3_9BACT|nr:MAG: hypothetical protein A2826_02725 [Candidatus Doudnabacteria bacterium RIFCSPHIGHO2_01_FULL_43_23]
MRKTPLVNQQIYHIYNRGVEKRNIFLDEKDYYRFIHDIYEFNDSNPARNLGFHFARLSGNSGKRESRTPRKMLVEVLCFCLMPNHYHLLLKQRTSGGITEFMRKLGTGYTNYFNKKNDRVGSLFQGRYKSVHIKNDQQLFYIPHYIHLNPLDLKYPEWREKKVGSISSSVSYLESYRWSSYLDFIEKANFPFVTQRDLLLKAYESRFGLTYEKAIKGWMKNLNLHLIKDILID